MISEKNHILSMQAGPLFEASSRMSSEKKHYAPACVLRSCLFCKHTLIAVNAFRVIGQRGRGTYVKIESLGGVNMVKLNKL